MDSPTEITPRFTMNGKPLHTVKVKRVLNPDSGFKKKWLCDGPTISCGDCCGFCCTYCFVPAMFNKLGRVAQLKEFLGLEHCEMVVRRENAVEILRREMVHASGKKKFPDPKDHRIVFISPTVDPAANMELVRETVEVCKVVLENSAWHIRILSKSNLLPHVAEALAAYRDRVIYGVSTGTLDDKVAASFELGAPLVSKRLESLRALQDEGFRTFGMICPSLPLGTPHDYAKFGQDAFEAIRGDRCEHVWAEVINARGESMDRTVAALESSGFSSSAEALRRVSSDSASWEEYNRQTFLAHADAYRATPSKLRYLTYTTKENESWWTNMVSRGAVLL